MSAGYTSSLVTDIEDDEPECSDIPPEHYLFNRQNLTLYGQAISNGLALMLKKISGVERPHSGASPEAIAQRFKGIDLDGDTTDIPNVLEELETLYLDDAMYFHHPRYVAHLNCPIAVPAILGELILSTVNSSLDTWDQSMGGTYIEQALIDWTAGRIGLGEDADGIFTSGGTQSNLMALLLARDLHCRARDPGHHVKRDGLPPDHRRLRILTSEASHFSVSKAAAVLGLGNDAVVTVPTDRDHRMDAGALTQQLERCHTDGLDPFAVVATAGTTDFGSIDPLAEIAAICRRHGLWLHVDAAYGCGLLVSQRYSNRLRGIGYADSVTVDYHKSFFQPVSCGAFLVRRGRELNCVTHHAEYLNPRSHRSDDPPNLVDKSLQTTRRFDALKLWLTLRTMGPRRIGEAFDRVVDLANEAYRLLREDELIEPLNHPELSTLVFRYRPASPCDAADIDRINDEIRAGLLRSGEAVVAGTRVAGHRCLKFTLLNPATSIDDIREVVALIKSHGARAAARVTAEPADATESKETNDE